MLYFMIRPFARLGLLALCRNIFISNTKVLKNDRPVILASNHPTAFLEPCILACFLPYPIHYVVRADFFRNAFITQVMYSLHLIPIHRRRNSDYRDLKQNFDLIEDMQQKLNDNTILMVLVEGSASIKKQLRPLQKGVGRIAFGTYERFKREDIEIIPVGVNFDDASKPRLTTMIGLGEPILLKNYLHLYCENKAKAINQLVKDIRLGIRENTIHLDDVENDELLLEQWLELYRNENPTPRFPIFQVSQKVLKQEQNLSDFINTLSESKKMEAKQKTSHYFQNLAQYQITDIAIKKEAPLSSLILYALGFLPMWIGYLLNFLPTLIGMSIAKKKVKRVQYFVPVAWGIGNMLYLLCLILLSIIVILCAFQYPLILVLFPVIIAATLLLGYLSIIYFENWQEWLIIRRSSRLDKAIKTRLNIQRNEILSYFGHLI